VEMALPLETAPAGAEAAAARAATPPRVSGGVHA